MSETSTYPASLRTGWNIDLCAAVCEHCHWRYLIPPGAAAPMCPNCYQGPLTLLPEGLAEATQTFVPELMIPFNLPKASLDEAVRSFASEIPFAPDSLSEPGLRARLMPVYLPLWLVDGVVTGYWQADAGFNYEVVSHQESYNGDQHQWQSREIKEPRIRWESRVGRISRSYQNVTTPALIDSSRLEKQLGPFNLDSARSYDSDCLPKNGHETLVRLPDHLPKEAWSEAAAAFQKAAAAECQQACAADHLRQFRWKADFSRLNWTLMLLPLYSASYQDDDGKPQPILIHGQTGKVAGVRKASMRKAGHYSLIILLAGIIFFLIGMLLDLYNAAHPFISVASTYSMIFGIAGIMAAAIPSLVAWDFNRKQALEQIGR